jgi:hypothetical protein
MKNQQRIFEVKDPPLRQCRRLLNWFAHIDIHQFDLHVRRYPNKSRERESWITIHEKIKSHRIIELWKWMRYENSHDADIYFRPHGPADHPVIFLDDLTLEVAHKVARWYSAAVIQTSHNNTQVWVKTSAPLTLSERKQAQSNLSAMGFTDAGSTSGDHLGRICGVFSHKRKTWVNAISFSTPHAYHPSGMEKSPIPRGRGACALKGKSGDYSPSEADFGWAIGMFKSGAAYEEVYSALYANAKSRGKRNPEKYATLTAKKSERLVRV